MAEEVDRVYKAALYRCLRDSLSIRFEERVMDGVEVSAFNSLGLAIQDILAVDGAKIFIDINHCELDLRNAFCAAYGIDYSETRFICSYFTLGLRKSFDVGDNKYDVDYVGVCLIMGKHEDKAVLFRSIAPTSAPHLIHPFNRLELMECMDNTISVPDGVRKSQLFIVEGTWKELIGIMASSRVSEPTKTASALYAYYPWIRDRARELGIVVNVDQYFTIHAGVPRGTLSRSEEEQRDQVAAVSFFYIVGYPFTRDKNIKEQIYRRYQAAMAQKTLRKIEQATFNQLVFIGKESTIMKDNRVTDLIGRTICFDKEGHYNVGLALSEIGQLEHILNGAEISGMAASIFTQLRLVMERFQQTSIKFGVDVLQMLERFADSFSPAFTADYDAANLAAIQIIGRPYTGCVLDLPKGLQIASMARVAYIGLKYYEYNLTTDSAREEWQHYQVDSVKAHIGSSRDATTCEIIANLLPRDTLAALGLLSRNSGADTIESCLKNVDGITEQMLYSYCALNHKDAPWFVRKRAARKADALREIVRARVDRLEKKLTEVVNASYTMIAMAKDESPDALSFSTVNLRQTAIRSKLRSLEDSLASDTELDEFSTDVDVQTIQRLITEISVDIDNIQAV